MPRWYGFRSQSASRRGSILLHRADQLFGTQSIKQNMIPGANHKNLLLSCPFAYVRYLSQSLAFIIAVKAVPQKQMQHLPQFKTPTRVFLNTFRQNSQPAALLPMESRRSG